jgi:L-malate glycosyltransferase
MSETAARPTRRVMQVVLTLGVGGTERLVIDLVQQLAPQVGFSVCCLDEAGEWGRQLKASGVSVAELGRTPGFHPSLAVRLAKLTSEWQIDVLHCHHYSPFVYGQLAAMLNPRLTVLFTEHGRLSGWTPSLKRRAANALLARLGARIFAVSHNLVETMAAEGLPRRRIEVVHNGIDPGTAPGAVERAAARARLGIGEAAEVVGTVARLDPVKDLETMVRALSLIREARPTCKLVIIGDGVEYERLVDVTAHLGVADAVILTGHRDDARALLPAFDVYINSSLSEGVSISILEAMAACLPVVATEVGGNPEIVVNDRSGSIVPARDPLSLAAAVVRLLESRDTRRTFGQAARARVLEGFTFDRMAQTYLRAYLHPRRV